MNQSNKAVYIYLFVFYFLKQSSSMYLFLNNPYMYPCISFFFMEEKANEYKA